MDTEWTYKKIKNDIFNMKNELLDIKIDAIICVKEIEKILYLLKEGKRDIREEELCNKLTKEINLKMSGVLKKV